jgi:hypothetical protein
MHAEMVEKVVPSEFEYYFSSGGGIGIKTVCRRQDGVEIDLTDYDAW